MSMSSSRRANRQVSNIRIVRAVAAAVAVAGIGNVARAATSGSWNDPATVSPTITGVVATSFTSSVALKDGDIVKVGATAGAGLNALTNYYVVGVGSTPSTTIKLSTSPGGAFNVTPVATAASTTAAADWFAPGAWSGGVPNGVDDSATISANANTTAIELTKNVTLGSLNFSGGTNDVNLMSTVVGNGGPFAQLTFATTGGTPTITASGGKSLTFSDSSLTATNVNGKLVVAGSQGLTIDNQNAIATLPAAPTANASAGAVKFGYLIDWSRFSGALTLSRGAFAALSGGAANGLSSLPINNEVILGTGANQAQLELLGNNANTYVRGLSGNSSSTIINSSNGGGPALTMGSYSTAGDSYAYAGSMGVPISALAAGSTPAPMRLIKIGAGTQVLTGNNAIQNGNVVTINGGTLSLSTTGTIGTATGPGQASTTAAIAAQALTMHNGEFKMVGTAANPRSQGFGGALVLTNGTGTGSSFSTQGNGNSTLTLVADAAQPISLGFASIIARNLGAASTNANANGQTTLYRGTNLGSTPGNGVATVKFTAAPTITGTAGTTNYGVLKGALADTNAAGSGAGFATYDATNGVRLLNYVPALGAGTEVDDSGYPVASAATNIRLNLAGPTAITGVSTQTLHLDNTSGSSQTVTNTGAALNATGGFLVSGTEPVFLTGGTITGTAATDNEDVVIHNLNSSVGGLQLGTAISNVGAASKPGWITYNGTGNFTITGTQTMGNSGGIAFNSTGATTLAGAISSATFLGVNRGYVKLSAGATFNNKPQLIVAAGATFDLADQSSATLTFDTVQTNVLYNNAGANAAGGIVTNSGASVIDLTLNGTASVGGLFPGSITGNLNLVLAKTSGTLSQVLTGVNTYVGTTKVSAGNSLIIARHGSLPSGTVVTLGDAGTNTAGILVLGDTNTNTSGGNGSVNQEVAGLFSAGTAATTAVVGGNPNASTLTVNYNGGSPDTFNGIIGGTAGTQSALTLRKIGSGTLSLGGAHTGNTYAGGTIIEGGILSVPSDSRLGNPGSVVGGTPTSPTSPVLNNIVLNGGTLQITGSTTIQTTRGIGVGPGTGGTGATGIVETSGAATVVTYGGVIASAGNSGTNNFTKTGAGTLVLGGANTYNGNTTVLGGLLNVTGSLANNGSGRVFVATDGDGTFGSSDDNIVSRLALTSYVGLGSTEIGALGSSSDIVQGANASGTDQRVTMRWRARATAETNGSSPPLPAGISQLASDVLSLTDMANSGGASGLTDAFALEVKYDAALGGDDIGNAASGGLYLAWLDTSGTPQWKNAVDGNTGVGGSAVTGYIGSYAAFASANSINDGNLANFLGSWGADPTGDRVWAVLNHNSELAAVSAPEPAALGMLAIAATGLMARRRRKAD